jgi:hypothetical protein
MAVRCSAGRLPPAIASGAVFPALPGLPQVAVPRRYRVAIQSDDQITQAPAKPVAGVQPPAGLTFTPGPALRICNLSATGGRTRLPPLVSALTSPCYPRLVSSTRCRHDGAVGRSLQSRHPSYRRVSSRPGSRDCGIPHASKRKQESEPNE